MTDILQEASELINGDRAQDYGDVTENFERIADLWTTYVGDVVPFTAFDVSNMMILVKVARIRSGSNGVGTGFHRDSYVDIAGYAALAEKVNDEIGLSQIQPVSQDFWDDIDESIKRAEDGIISETEARILLGIPPRVWDSLNDVPVGVEVTDVDGDEWFGDGNEEEDVWTDKFGPFTEVLS